MTKLIVLLLAGICLFSACGKNGRYNLFKPSGTGSGGRPAKPNPGKLHDGTTLYAKYGGQSFVQAVIDSASSSWISDPRLAPYFGNLGNAGHDTLDRFKSCLDLQFIVLFGGPGNFPGTSNYRGAPGGGYDCHDMWTAHKGVHATIPAFDWFLSDLAQALRLHGVSEKDIGILWRSLLDDENPVINH